MICLSRETTERLTIADKILKSVNIEITGPKKKKKEVWWRQGENRNNIL